MNSIMITCLQALPWSCDPISPPSSSKQDLVYCLLCAEHPAQGRAQTNVLGAEGTLVMNEPLWRIIRGAGRG